MILYKAPRDQDFIDGLLADFVQGDVDKMLREGDPGVIAVAGSVLPFSRPFLSDSLEKRRRRSATRTTACARTSPTARRLRSSRGTTPSRHPPPPTLPA